MDRAHPMMNPGSPLIHIIVDNFFLPKVSLRGAQL